MAWINRHKIVTHFWKKLKNHITLIYRSRAFQWCIWFLSHYIFDELIAKIKLSIFPLNRSNRSFLRYPHSTHYSITPNCANFNFPCLKFIYETRPFQRCIQIYFYITEFPHVCERIFKSFFKNDYGESVLTVP